MPLHTTRSDEKFLRPGLQVARYSAGKQQPDGSWYYGEAPSQRWIDNFHTGYNLCALRAIARYAGTTEFDREFDLRLGVLPRISFARTARSATSMIGTIPSTFTAWRKAFSLSLTLKELDPGNLPLAHSVLQWALTHLWDDRGFFYYRVLRSCTNRIVVHEMVASVDASGHGHASGRFQAVTVSTNPTRRLAGVARRAHD